MSMGGYPMGAQYDTRAPWNQKEPTMVECTACAGKGHHWYACDIRNNTTTECTELVWICFRRRRMKPKQEVKTSVVERLRCAASVMEMARLSMRKIMNPIMTIRK